jgi:hypothetical protein
VVTHHNVCLIWTQIVRDKIMSYCTSVIKCSTPFSTVHAEDSNQSHRNNQSKQYVLSLLSCLISCEAVHAFGYPQPSSISLNLHALPHPHLFSQHTINATCQHHFTWPSLIVPGPARPFANTGCPENPFDITSVHGTTWESLLFRK